MKKRHFSIACLVWLAMCCTANAQEVKMMHVSSRNFDNQTVMAAKYTCDGDDVSPDLTWTGVTEGTKSFVLIVDDPDAPDPAKPRMTWVLYNLPATTRALPEGGSEKDLPEACLQGLNGWKRTGYGGPCPPIGTHRYFHKLYALDTVLPDLNLPTKAKLEKAMEGHVLGKAELIGLYRRH